jgi:hypothetical protein
MIWGPQEFLDVVHTIAVRRGWRACPRDAAILDGRKEALALNDDSGSRVVEAAALFFALSRDEHRLRPVPHALPIWIVLRHLWEHRLELRTANSAELGWMRHSIAEGSADWPAVRAWFIERCVSR